jgi:hypothetical protein
MLGDVVWTALCCYECMEICYGCCTIWLGWFCVATDGEGFGFVLLCVAMDVKISGLDPPYRCCGSAMYCFVLL